MLFSSKETQSLPQTLHHTTSKFNATHSNATFSQGRPVARALSGPDPPPKLPKSRTLLSFDGSERSIGARVCDGPLPAVAVVGLVPSRAGAAIAPVVSGPMLPSSIEGDMVGAPPSDSSWVGVGSAVGSAWLEVASAEGSSTAVVEGFVGSSIAVVVGCAVDCSIAVAEGCDTGASVAIVEGCATGSLTVLAEGCATGCSAALVGGAGTGCWTGCSAGLVEGPAAGGSRTLVGSLGVMLMVTMGPTTAYGSDASVVLGRELEGIGTVVTPGPGTCPAGALGSWGTCTVWMIVIASFIELVRGCFEDNAIRLTGPSPGTVIVTGAFDELVSDFNPNGGKGRELTGASPGICTVSVMTWLTVTGSTWMMVIGSLIVTAGYISVSRRVLS